MLAKRHSATVGAGLALALAIATTGCDIEKQVAPDDAVLLLSAEADSLAPEGAATVLTAVIQLATGDLVPYAAKVNFFATAGGLCAVATSQNGCGSGAGAPVPLFTSGTQQGLARATYVAGSQEGTVTITARSGSVADTIQVVVKRPVLDE